MAWLTSTLSKAARVSPEKRAGSSRQPTHTALERINQCCLRLGWPGTQHKLTEACGREETHPRTHSEAETEANSDRVSQLPQIPSHRSVLRSSSSPPPRVCVCL